MSKPTVSEAMELMELKKSIDNAYEALRLKMEEFVGKYGDGRFDFENPDKESEHKYFHITITDNLKLLQQEGIVYKNTALSKYSFEKKFLKRLPSSLKNEEV